MEALEHPSVAIIGLGYIGLPTAAILANSGLKVLGIDVNEAIVETLNKGNIHIAEDGLAELVAKAIKSGNFKAYSHGSSS